MEAMERWAINDEWNIKDGGIVILKDGLRNDRSMERPVRIFESKDNTVQKV